MKYNPDQAEEVENNGKFPADVVLNAVVYALEEGKVKDFITNTEKWNDPEQPCILVHYEVRSEQNILKDQHLFTFKIGENGQTQYNKLSNIGKYKQKYGNLPAIGDKVKITTDTKGYAHIKIE